MEGEGPLLKEGSLSLQTSLTLRELPPRPRILRSEDLFRFLWWRGHGGSFLFLTGGDFQMVRLRACLVSRMWLERMPYTRASHSPIGRDSRTLQKNLPPQKQKLSPRAPAPNKAKQIFALHGRVLLGKVLGERGRFGGREPRLSRGGSLPPRSSPATSKIFRRCSQKRLVFFRKVRYHIG